MQLVMFLGNDFIASIAVDSHLLSAPGYLGQLKRQLLTDHTEILQYTPHKPEFLIVDISGTDADQKKRKE